MKKWIALILAVLLLALAACGSKEEPQAEEPAETAGTTEEAAASSLPYTETRDDYGFDTGANFESSVIYEDEQVTITANGLEYSADGYVSLLLNFANKSEGQQTYTLDDSSVNGLMQFAFLMEFTDGGQSIDARLDFSYDSLLPAAVDCIKEIRLYNLNVMDADGNVNVLDTISLRTNAYGTGEDVTDCYETYTSARMQESFWYTVAASAQDRIDIASGVYANAQFYEPDEYYSQLILQLYNDTDQPVTVYADRMKLNGIGVYADMSTYATLMPHTRSLIHLGLSDSLPAYCFESMNFTEISEISFDIYPENSSDRISYVFTVPGADAGAVSVPEGKTVYDEDGVTISYIDLVEAYEEEDYVGEVTLVLLVKNASGKEICIQDQGEGALLINGESIEHCSYYYTIPDGDTDAVSFMSYSYLTDCLGIKNLEEVTEMQLTVTISDDAFDFSADPVTLTLLGD